MNLLHTTELPLRHLSAGVHGATSGIRGFSGSFGKQLLTCSKQPVSSFKPVTLTKQLSNLDPKQSRIDQQCLLEMCNSINTGQCRTNLEMGSPGYLNNSRWLTTANEIL